MIAGLKPYPTMKDSGVEWLGEVPEHWKVVPNRAVMRLKKQVVGESADDYTLLSLTKRGIIARDMENPEGKFPASFDTYQIVEPGDLIFCLFDIDETPRSVGLSSMNGMITGAYTRFVCPDELTRQFIYLLYLFLDNGKRLKPLYSGLRKVITKSKFLSAKLVLPPAQEQAAIVRYLDYMDKRIRKYIRAKQKLIKLLEEQKQAIIHRAVTHGLDPNVPLKSSGVEWLGDVPEHWEVVAIRRCAKTVKTGGTPTGAVDEHFSTPGFNWYTPSDFKDDLYLGASERQLSEFGKEYVRIFPPNTVMMIGIGATIGKVAISKGYASCNQQINGIVLDNWMDVKYFSLSLRSLREYIISCGKFTTMPIINQAETRSLPIPVPPISEQQKIVEYILSQIASIDQTISRACRGIKLLNEYRNRLIADVVTGKLDVRKAATNLSEEAAEPEHLNETTDPSDTGNGAADDIDPTIEED